MVVGLVLSCAATGTADASGREHREETRAHLESLGEMCGEGIEKACYELRLLATMTLPDAEARAVELSRSACDEGIALGCYNLGVLYDQGDGVAKDVGMAATLYRKAGEA
jgi:hypothetical protein